MVISTAFAVVTIMGSIYGASLKSEQQVKTVSTPSYISQLTASVPVLSVYVCVNCTC